MYSYEETDASYFGCLHKVFSPELDLAAFCGTPGGAARTADPYGSLRVTRSPRPQCSVRVEQAYAALSTPGCCCNPTFFLHPSGSGEAIRLTANLKSDPHDGHQG